MTPDLIPPHGGLTEPVDRSVPNQEAAAFRQQAKSWKRVPISDADLSTLYRLGDGGLSPLTGPMDGETFRRVLDDEVISRDGKAYAWTIPISFPVDATLSGSLKKGETVALINGQDEIVGSLTIGDIFPFDKARYIKSVYGTERADHPGSRMGMTDPGEKVLGGEDR